MVDWLRDRAWEIGIGSAAMLLVGILLVPVLVGRMPADYFVRPAPRSHRHPVLRGLLLVVANTIGAALVLAGIAMLVLPGQGVLTILVGLGLVTFPGKRRLELWIVSRPAVFKALQWLRARAGRPPLLLP